MIAMILLAIIVGVMVGMVVSDYTDKLWVAPTLAFIAAFTISALANLFLV